MCGTCVPMTICLCQHVCTYMPVPVCFVPVCSVFVMCLYVCVYTCTTVRLAALSCEQFLKMSCSSLSYCSVMKPCYQKNLQEERLILASGPRGELETRKE